MDKDLDIEWYFYENVIAREAAEIKNALIPDSNGDLIYPNRPDWKILFIDCSCGHSIAAHREDDRVYCLACTGEIKG